MRATLLLLLSMGCDSLGDKLLTELTIDERIAVCESFDMPRKTVDCEGRSVRAGLEEGACSRETIERAPVNAACRATVAEYRACMIDIYEQPCTGHASCAVVQGCFAASGD